MLVLMAHALGTVTRVAPMLLQIVLMPGLWIETSRGRFIVVVAVLLRLLTLAVRHLLSQKLMLILRLLLPVVRRCLTCCLLWGL